MATRPRFPSSAAAAFAISGMASVVPAGHVYVTGSATEAREWAQQASSAALVAAAAVSTAEATKEAAELAASNASMSEATALAHSNTAKTYRDGAQTSAQNAANSASTANTRANAAATSAGNALTSEQNAKASENAAEADRVTILGHVETARVHMVNAGASATSANTAATNLATAVTNASNAANRAETAALGIEAHVLKASQWAESGTAVEPGKFSARYWAQQAAAVVTGGVQASSVPFTPQGNIAAQDVQSAISELDAEKYSRAGEERLNIVGEWPAFEMLDTGAATGTKRTRIGAWDGVVEVQRISDDGTTWVSSLLTLNPNVSAMTLFGDKTVYHSGNFNPTNYYAKTDTLPVASASSVPFAPSGNIAATNVQAAIVEVYAEKANLVHQHVMADLTDLGSWYNANVANIVGAKQDLSERGQAGGYASLGPDGVVPADQLPPPPALVASLNDLADVSITDPLFDQVLKFDGTRWTNLQDNNSGTGTSAPALLIRLDGAVIPDWEAGGEPPPPEPTDTTPAAYSFSDIPNAELGTTYTSNTLTPTAFDAPAPISITGGSYSINGGGFTTAAGTLQPGQNITLRVTSDNSNSTAKNVVVTIGGISDTWTVTTKAAAAADTTPNQFSFNDVTNAELNTEYTSLPLAIGGITGPANISITGGTYSIAGGAFTSAPGTITNGQEVRVKGTSSTSNSAATNVVLTIGGIVDTFTITTKAATQTGSTVNMPTFTSGPWKITMPYNEDIVLSKTGDALEIWPPELATHESIYFDKQPDGSILFRAPTDGARTSGSSYVRCELREILADASNEYDWPVSTGGRLEATLEIQELPVLTKGSTNRFIVGQIHGPNDEPCRLYYYSDGTMRFRDDKAGAGTSGTETEFYLTTDGTSGGTRTNVGFNQEITYVIEMDITGTKCTVWHNGTKYWAFSPKSNFWTASTLCYFKSGVYNAVGYPGQGTSSEGTGQAKALFKRILNPVHPHTISATSNNKSAAAKVTFTGKSGGAADSPVAILNFAPKFQVVETAEGVYRVDVTIPDSGGGGGGGADILPTGLVFDNGATDNTAALNAAVDTAVAQGGGKIVVQGPTGGALGISGIVNLKSNVEIEFRSPLLYGPAAQMRGMGALANTTTLTANTTVGARTISVSSTAGLSVGNYVLIEDDTTAGSSNLTNVEVNEIMGISGSTLTLAHPINVAFLTAANARLTKIDPIRNVRIKGARMSYSATPTNSNAYPFELKYAVDSVIEDCQVLGDPATGIGSSAQAFRMYACYRCMFDNVTVYRPSEALSGQGYGAAIYYGTRQSVVRNSFFSGCRHSLILFQGVSDCIFIGNVSVDCRGTDYDLHGANEIRNLFTGNVSVGGPSTSDINGRSAFKVGNTTHRAGSHRNSFIGNEVHNHEVAFHVVPTSSDNLIHANTVQNCTGGVFLQRLSANLALRIRGNIITGNTFRATGAVLSIDGNDTGNRAVEDTVFSNNVAHASPVAAGAAVQIYYANGLKAMNNHIEAANEANPAVAITGTTGMRAANWFIEGGSQAAISLTTTADAKMDDFKFGPRPSREVLTADAGSVFELTNYRAIGFDALFGNPANENVKITSANENSADGLDALAYPYAITGVAISFSAAAPSPTAAPEIVAVTLKPTTPRGKMRFSANVPAVVTSTAENGFMCVTVSENGGPERIVGIGTWRLTSGATSGTGQSINGFFTHSLTDMSQNIVVRLRLAPRASTTTFTLGSTFDASVRCSLTVRE